MSTLTTVPRGTTTFKPYDKPRYSKSKRFENQSIADLTYDHERLDELCCNCHQPNGNHYIDDLCPEYQILNK